MLKIETKTDESLFAALKKLFMLYAKEARNGGKYYIFLPEDVLAEKIDLRSRQTAASMEDGLHELGKLIYFLATKESEDTDPSIRIDGYPPIDSIVWAMLQIMLSREGMPNIENIEKKIKEIEEKKKKIENVTAIKTNNTQLNVPFDQSLLQGCTVMNAEFILEMIITFVKSHEEALGIGHYTQVWASMEEDGTLFKMIPDNARLLALIDKAEFMADKTQIPEIVKTWNRVRVCSDKSSFIYGLEKLRNELQGKKVLSFMDKKRNWYIKVQQS